MPPRLLEILSCRFSLDHILFILIEIGVDWWIGLISSQLIFYGCLGNGENLYCFRARGFTQISAEKQFGLDGILKICVHLRPIHFVFFHSLPFWTKGVNYERGISFHSLHG
jgi:hypothetical protein